jgi:tellurite resistance protein
MKRIKHSKFKNTGFLFELLTRQITLEILNGGEEKSKNIVKEFFNKKTQLSKELHLFNLLLNEKQLNEHKSEKFIDVILEAHSKIDYEKLNEEKYRLVKQIKENFDVENFFASPITNYKLLASIHKLFEAKKINATNVKDVFKSRETLVEHISKKPTQKQINKNELVETYQKQEQDVRLLTYKILVKFKEYYKTQLKETISSLYSLYKSMTDKVTKIKLRETINVLKEQKINREVKDNQVSSLMMAFELIKEINHANR